MGRVNTLPVVATTDSLVIRQQKEMLEIVTDFETKNRYEIDLPDGRTIMHAMELGQGGWEWLRRNFLNTKRPFHIELSDERGQDVMHLHRPWRWLFSRVEVLDGNRAPIGAIQQRFSILSRRFSVLDPSGTEIAILHGPLLRPWTFRVMVRGQEVGKITKEWSGLLREAFTDADTFGVQFGPGMDPRLRSLALAATFLIDFLYFERKNNQ
jgi:uncharacterized protein YxjI